MGLSEVHETPTKRSSRGVSYVSKDSYGFVRSPEKRIVELTRNRLVPAGY